MVLFSATIHCYFRYTHLNFFFIKLPNTKTIDGFSSGCRAFEFFLLEIFRHATGAAFAILNWMANMRNVQGNIVLWFLWFLRDNRTFIT